MASDVEEAMNASLSASVSAAASGQADLDNLYPALVECFGIIVLGYLAAKLGLVSEVESHGLSTFAGTFALPALIFGNLCALDFGSVSWSFLAAVLLAKAALFAVTALGVLAAVRPPDPLRAGLYAIFVTQSNDFALGFPILQAIYGASHPEIPMYLYLFAPISLVILNPIGFVLMEIGKNDEGEEQGNADGSRKLSKAKLLQIAKNVVTNPIIFMTVAGIIANFVFSQTLPDIINRLLKTLGSAFSACALFLLGLRIVSKSSDEVKGSKASGLIIYAILILLKTVALPLVSREFVNAFGANDVENNSTWTSAANHSYTSVMSDFAFLYGTFPTAPSVFVYAVNYEVEPELVASAMVACTFVAAPIMFVSAKLMSLTDVDPKDYIDELDNFLLDISILGLAAAVWTAVVFFATKRHAKVPHFMTLALIIAQGISCIGAIMWSMINCGHGWKLYLQFIFYAYGVYASRINTALLSVVIFLAHIKPNSWLLEKKLYFLIPGFTIPAVLVVTLLMSVASETRPHGDKIDPNFQYGQTQTYVALAVLVLCFLVTCANMVLTQRYRHLRTGVSHTGPRRRSREEAERHLLDVTESDSSSEAHGSRPTPNYRAVEEHTGQEDRQSPIPIEDLLQIGNDDANEEETVCCEDEAERGRLRDDRRRQLQQQGRSGEGGGDGQSNAGEVRRRYRCNTEHQDYCSSLLRSYAVPPAREADHEHVSVLAGERGGEAEADDGLQITPHVILLLFLVTSMFVGIALCIWTLVMENKSGVYLELVFLDGFLNFGQGIFSFALFGLDYKYMTVPLQHWYRRVMYGADSLVLPQWEDLSQETKQLCQQFLKHHVSRCVPAVVGDVRCRLTVYRGVFHGSELVDWLLEVGLARDRADAVAYARHLVKGRVIRHIDNYLDFYDDCFLYTFQPMAGQAAAASHSQPTSTSAAGARGRP